MHTCYCRICILSFQVLNIVNRDISIVHLVIIKHGQELTSITFTCIDTNPNHSSECLYGLIISSVKKNYDCKHSYFGKIFNHLFTRGQIVHG